MKMQHNCQSRVRLLRKSLPWEDEKQWLMCQSYWNIGWVMKVESRSTWIQYDREFIDVHTVNVLQHEQGKEETAMFWVQLGTAPPLYSVPWCHSPSMDTKKFLVICLFHWTDGTMINVLTIWSERHSSIPRCIISKTLGICICPARRRHNWVSVETWHWLWRAILILTPLQLTEPPSPHSHFLQRCIMVMAHN